MLPAWASPLRDLPNRLTLSPPLSQQLEHFVSLDEKDARFGPEAIRLATELVTWLDAELARLTEQRIALGDPGGVRQRLVGEPRRQVDQTLSAVKGRFQSERQEWSRRIQKQLAEVLDAVDAELRKLTLETRVQDNTGLTEVPETWRLKFGRWLDDTLTTWGQHFGELLPSKLTSALQFELDQLRKQLGDAVKVELSRPAVMAAPLTGLEFPELKESTEVPTVVAAFFDTFKDGLNTVAMMAGLVIVPVVGQLSDKQPTAVRAGIISALLIPVLVFAAFQTRASRKKLAARLGEKAQEKLRKSLEQYARTRVDRFAKEAERHVGSWLSAVQSDVCNELESQAASVFGRREANVAGEIAKVALQSDRLQDQIQTIRQLRNGPINTFVIEARRKATTS